MSDFARVRFAEKVACHRHSSNASELSFRNGADASNIGVRNRALERNAGKHLEMTEPADTGNALVLDL